MEEEYKTSYNIYKEEKNKLLEELKNFKGNDEAKIKLLNNLAYYDDMLEKYSTKISFIINKNIWQKAYST